MSKEGLKESSEIGLYHSEDAELLSAYAIYSAAKSLKNGREKEI